MIVSPSRRRSLLGLVFFLSGASSLVYEVLWSRQLSLVFGSTLSAVSIVLAIFMGGLAAGALVIGRVVDHRADLLRIYAAMELLIGLAAAGVSWAVPRLWMSEAAATSLFHSPAVQVGVVIALLLPPTVLMGGTLPLLVRYLARVESEVGLTVARLYAWNTAGAVLGCLSTDFLLVRTVGVLQTALLAASVNACLCLAILAIRAMDGGLASTQGGALPSDAERPEPRADADDAGDGPEAGASEDRLRPAVLLAVAFVSGLCALAYEVAWTRVLLFFNGSDVYVFSIMLGTLLAGIAVGSALLAPRLDRLRRPAWVLAGLQGAIGVAALLPFVVVRFFPALYDWMSRDLRGLEAWETIYRGAVTVAVVLLPSVLMGMTFPLVNRLFSRSLSRLATHVGVIYCWNTVGGIIGSSLAGFVLVPVLGVQRTLIVIALGNGAAGALLVSMQAATPPARRLAACLLMAAVPLGALLLPSDYLTVQTYGRRFQGVFHTSEDYYGSLALMEDVDPSSGERFRALLVNGYPMTATNFRGQRYMRLLAHLPMLLHPAPRDVLVVCFGTGQTLSAAALHASVQRLDCADLSPAVLDLAPCFARWNHDVIKDRRVSVMVKDGRTQVLQSRERYDVITAEPPPPHNMGVVNLYSREYYTLCRRALRPGGYVCQWLPVYQMSPADTRALIRAFVDVFPDAGLWEGYKDDLCLVGSKEAGRPTVAGIAERVSTSPLRDDLRAIGIASAADLLGCYLTGGAALARSVATDAPVTDDRPSLEYSHASGVVDIPMLFFSRQPVTALVEGPVPPEVQAAALRSEALDRLLYVSLKGDTLSRIRWLDGVAALLRQSPDRRYAENLLGFTPAVLQMWLSTGVRSPNELAVVLEIAWALERAPEVLAALKPSASAIGDPYILYLAGLCCRQAGRLDEGRAFWARALELEPSEAGRAHFRDLLRAR